MSDAAFERVCNLALKLIIFFSPRLRSLRLTTTLGTATSPYIFRYALGLIPLPITNLGAFSIRHENNCAEFLTVLNIDLSALRVCYGSHLLGGRASRCLESIEELTVVDDGEVGLGPEDEHRRRGIEPDFLYVWLEPAKRLKKFLLYTGFDIEELAGQGLQPLSHNINTILLCHRETLRHFEWCQTVNPRRTDETAWKKVFGEEQKLACLPQLKEDLSNFDRWDYAVGFHLKYYGVHDLVQYMKNQYPEGPLPEHFKTAADWQRWQRHCLHAYSIIYSRATKVIEQDGMSNHCPHELLSIIRAYKERIDEMRKEIIIFQMHNKKRKI